MTPIGALKKILDKCSGVYTPTIMAVQEIASEALASYKAGEDVQAILFGKWLNIDFTDREVNGSPTGENNWRKMNTDEIYTTEQLYKIWKNNL